MSLKIINSILQPHFPGANELIHEATVHLRSYSTDTSNCNYRKISNIRRTKSQNLNDSHLVLKSSLPNPLKPCVKSRMKM